MTDASRSHLHPQLQSVLDLPVAARKRALCSDRWIPYSAAKEVLSALGELLAQPQSPRMPNMLLFGDSANGKTALTRYFRDSQNPKDDHGAIAAHIPIVYCLCPPTPEETRLYVAILESVFAPYSLSVGARALRYQVARVLEQLGVRMLILDEIHQVLQGSTAKQSLFLNLLKNLTSELQIGLVGVGTEKALNAIGTDEQLQNRFEPHSLPRWKLDVEWRALLASFESLLPLQQPSDLQAPEMAALLHDKTGGLIGELVKLLRKAGNRAIDDGSEHISIPLLKKVRWTRPSRRREGQADS